MASAAFRMLGLRYWRTQGPGIGLALGLAFTASLVAQKLGVWLSTGQSTPISPVFCAVVIGVAWRNGPGVHARSERGVRWVTSTLLRFGIALVGLRLTLSGLADLATVVLPVVVGCIAVALAVSALMGRWFAIDSRLRALIAMGTAVCGCAAIMATAPFVRAKPEQTAVAVTCVVLFGCLAMLVYPWLAHLLFGSGRAAGIFLGTAIHDTSQVIGASLIHAQQFGGGDTVATAGATKLLRNLSLLILVPWVARGFRERGAAVPTASPRLLDALPGFLIAFLLLALVRSVGDAMVINTPVMARWWQASVAAEIAASDVCLTCGMAAIGLSVSCKHLRSIGWRAPTAALLVALAVALTSITLVRVFVPAE